MSSSCTSESTTETCSTIDSSVEYTSKRSEVDTNSDRNSSTGSELLELQIHTLVVETRARDLDREVQQDHDSDRYLFRGEKFLNNPSGDLKMITVSKRSMRLLR